MNYHSHYDDDNSNGYDDGKIEHGGDEETYFQYQYGGNDNDIAVVDDPYDDINDVNSKPSSVSHDGPKRRQQQQRRRRRQQPHQHHAPNSNMNTITYNINHNTNDDENYDRGQDHRYEYNDNHYQHDRYESHHNTIRRTNLFISPSALWISSTIRGQYRIWFAIVVIVLFQARGESCCTLVFLCSAVAFSWFQISAH
jgi:hypothetical protein